MKMPKPPSRFRSTEHSANIREAPTRARRFTAVVRACFAWLALLGILFVTTGAELSFEPVILDPNYIAYERDVGDIDGDGDNDLVAIQEGETTLQVFRAPEWKRSTLVTFTGAFRFPRADDFKLADMDGDGDLDIVTRLGDGPASDGPGIAVWCENLGQGTKFIQHVIGSSLEYTKDIVVVDFDRDQRLDVAMRMDSRTQLWLQDTGGKWSEVLLTHPPHEGMEAADLDKDGDPDLILNGYWFPTPDTAAAARVAANYIKIDIDTAWFTQTGDWTANSCKVVVGDFDGDGANDVAFSQSERAGHAVTWYRSATPLVPGTWKKEPVAVVDFCHTLLAADWDLDGDADLLVGGMIQSRHRGLKLMLNGGTGTNWSEFLIQTNGSYSAESGDIDNDGDLDIVGIRNWNSAPTYIYRNQVRSGARLDAWFHHEISSAHVRTFGLCFPDVDSDGDLDIASGPFVYLNPGSPLTDAWRQVALPSGVHAFASLDVDGDLDVDLISQKDNSGADRLDLFWIEAANAAGTEWAARALIGHVPRSEHAEGFQGYRVAQLIEGGRAEIAVSTMQGIYYFAVPENPAAGNWPRTRVALNDSDENVSVADFDRDGQLDICFTTGASKEVKWARNPGDGSPDWSVFTIGSFPEADWPDRCEAADLNGDGRVDIVVTEENSGKTPDALACLWEQPATGATQTHWVRHTITTQFTMNNLDLADVDSDGDIDLVLAEHRGTKRIAVWENDGRGMFAERRVGEGRESHLGGRLADLDGDGDLDLVSIAYDDFKKLNLWRNDSRRSAAVTGGPEELMSVGKALAESGKTVKPAAADIQTTATIAPSRVPAGVRLTENAVDDSAGDAACYKIETPGAIYFLEKSGAGLSSMVDRDGCDWLSFEPTPGTGAAGEYRGFPNAVDHPTRSFFHAMNSGTARSMTKVEHASPERVTISAVSSDDQWACRYDFLLSHCTFTMTRMPPAEKFWVLYEGTPGGQFDDTDWWMTSGVSQPKPMSHPHDGDIPAPEWIAFGDSKPDRVLFLLHHEDDSHPDRFYQMNQKMTVFGFGRQGMTKFLDRLPQSVSIGFLETTNRAEITRSLEKLRVTSSP